MYMQDYLYIAVLALLNTLISLPQFSTVVVSDSLSDIQYIVRKDCEYESGRCLVSADRETSHMRNSCDNGLLKFAGIFRGERTSWKNGFYIHCS